MPLLMPVGTSSLAWLAPAWTVRQLRSQRRFVQSHMRQSGTFASLTHTCRSQPFFPPPSHRPASPTAETPLPPAFAPPHPPPHLHLLLLLLLTATNSSSSGMRPPPYARPTRAPQQIDGALTNAPPKRSAPPHLVQQGRDEQHARPRRIIPRLDAGPTRRGTSAEAVGRSRDPLVHESGRALQHDGFAICIVVEAAAAGRHDLQPPPLPLAAALEQFGFVLNSVTSANGMLVVVDEDVVHARGLSRAAPRDLRR